MEFSAKLLKYIKTNHLKKMVFAADIGITQSMISRYLHDGRMPSYWTAKAIQERTNGYITMQDMGYE